MYSVSFNLDVFGSSRIFFVNRSLIIAQKRKTSYSLILNSIMEKRSGDQLAESQNKIAPVEQMTNSKLSLMHISQIIRTLASV